MFQAKTILVTGAAGFIGSNFVRMLLKKNNEIKTISLDKLTYAGSLKNLEKLENQHNNFFIHGDIADEKLIAEILRKYCIDTIVHFAAESHVDNSISGPKVFFETNVMGTLNLVQQAKLYWLERSLVKLRFHFLQ